MAQQRGRTLNSGKPGDVAHVELYRDDNGVPIATGETIKVPSNLYFVADEWCVVNDFLRERQQPELRLCATENLHGPFPELERSPLEEARQREFLAGEAEAAEAETPEQ